MIENGLNLELLTAGKYGHAIYIWDLHGAWDAQFYPEGIRGWVVKVDALADRGLKLNPDFFIPFEGERPIRFAFRAVILRQTLSVFLDEVGIAQWSHWGCQDIERTIGLTDPPTISRRGR